MMMLRSSTIKAARLSLEQRKALEGLKSRSLHTVSVQLDYYMSTQFAGIACALSNDLYAEAGLDLHFLPICPVGEELVRVRENANKSVTIGSVEQNIFIPTLYKNPSLSVQAVAAMFRRSPLCLASLISDDSPDKTLVVGAHEDTVSLIDRILNDGTEGANAKYNTIASPRATKNTDLKSGKLDMIQAYLTTEVPTLEKELGNAITAPPLEGMNGAKLGYSQVLFSPEEHLQGDKLEVVRAFLDATFKGWEMAIRDNESGARCVNEARALLKLDEEDNDHWEDSFEYTVQSTGLCCDFVKETFQGDRYGVISPKRWNEATQWLLSNKSPSGPDKNFGLKSDVWQPPSNLMAGSELARETLNKAKLSALKFANEFGRKPSLAVITVGELTRYTDGSRRLDIYSNRGNSWFDKTGVGMANGFDVQEYVYPSATTTTEELLKKIEELSSDNVDGIQLMWPLPDHLDSARLYEAISVTRDVDGAHYIGQRELAPGNKSSPLPPVTPAAVMALLDEYDVQVVNANVLVVGRSRIVGSPLAHMLREKGAVVTVAHSGVSTDKLESLVNSADVIFACAGSPGLLKAEWLNKNAQVINVGTTFVKEKDCLVSDFEGDLTATASRFSPVPGGVGPLSVAHLFKNVADAAWSRMENDSAATDLRADAA